MAQHPWLTEVGRKIARLREEAALTQENVARRIGVRVGHLNKMEMGQVDIDIDLLGKIADFFGKELTVRFV